MINVVSPKDGKPYRMKAKDYQERKASAFLAGNKNYQYNFEYEFEREYFEKGIKENNLIQPEIKEGLR